MSHYFYKCFDCNTEFDSTFIESNFHYLCPKCGSAEKQKPLQGVLLVEYDYESLKKKISPKRLLSAPAGNLSSYPELLPLKYSYHNPNIFENLNSNLAEHILLSSNPVSQLMHNVKFLNDTRNPTFSFKDRASILVVLKALQMGISKISAASTGNAGSSIAGICARFGMESYIFVPERIPAAKRMQIQIYGAKLYIVKADYDQAFDLCLEISKKMKWYNRNTAYNPLTIEGKKTAALDIFISQKGIIPDQIFIPSGDGVILSGLYKGFYDMLKLGWIENLPRLICVQAEGSDAIIRYTENGQFYYKPAETIADSICAGAPRNLYMASYAIKSSCGDTIRVSDPEIIAAQSLAAHDSGILIEPAAAASFAGFLKYKEHHEGLADKKTMLLFTGNGLKDVGSLLKNIPEVKSYEPEEIKSLF